MVAISASCADGQRNLNFQYFRPAAFCRKGPAAPAEGTGAKAHKAQSPGDLLITISIACRHAFSRFRGCRPAPHFELGRSHSYEAVLGGKVRVQQKKKKRKKKKTKHNQQRRSCCREGGEGGVHDSHDMWKGRSGMDGVILGCWWATGKSGGESLGVVEGGSSE